MLLNVKQNQRQANRDHAQHRNQEQALENLIATAYEAISGEELRAGLKKVRVGGTGNVYIYVAKE